MQDRRQILLGMSALIAGGLLPGSAIALEKSLSGAAPGAHTPKAAVLTDTQLKAVGIIADIILPETDTPSATGVGVHSFVDHALAHWLLKEETAAFLKSLDHFLARTPSFAGLGEDAQIRIVKDLDDSLGALPEGLGFYHQLKELVLIGYYTSEVGATEELAYDPVPGGYVPFKMTKETKAWAT